MQIEINNVSFSYGKNEKLALDNVSFNVSKGDFLCIVGKTGSGKSTLIQMLNGLLLPDKGYIKVDDYIITSDKKLKKSLLKDKSKEIKKINKRIEQLKKALKEFELTEHEIDIIMKHMFPLTLRPPRYREAVLVCIADKICAWGETIEGRLSFG